MNFRNLRAFVEVIRQGGFSAAAKVVYATQSTVTKAVQQLEEEFGSPLLLRLGHTVSLTDLGQVVYQRAITILGERDHLLSDVAEFKGLRKGILRIGLPPVGSSILFAPLLAEFRQQHPNIEIVLQEHGSARLMELIQTREIDLGALLLPLDDETFAWLTVCNEPMMALLPADHPLVGRSSIRLGELEDSPLVLFDKGFALNHVIDAACRRRGFAPREAARSGQPDFISALVAAGLGVAMLPRLVVTRHVYPTVHVALIDEEDFRWRLAMVWRKGAFLTPSAHAWLKLIEGYAASHASDPVA
jgi:DNA-binding transcriptional LysR family regulator